MAQVQLSMLHTPPCEHHSLSISCAHCNHTCTLSQFIPSFPPSPCTIGSSWCRLPSMVPLFQKFNLGCLPFYPLTGRVRGKGQPTTHSHTRYLVWRSTHVHLVCSAQYLALEGFSRTGIGLASPSPLEVRSRLGFSVFDS